MSLSHDKPKNMTKVKTKNIDSSCSCLEQTGGKHDGAFRFCSGVNCILVCSEIYNVFFLNKKGLSSVFRFL